MLFVCHTTQNKVYLILSYLILTSPLPSLSTTVHVEVVGDAVDVFVNVVGVNFDIGAMTTIKLSYWIIPNTVFCINGHCKQKVILNVTYIRNWWSNSPANTYDLAFVSAYPCRQYNLDNDSSCWTKQDNLIRRLLHTEPSSIVVARKGS